MHAMAGGGAPALPAVADGTSPPNKRLKFLNSPDEGKEKAAVEGNWERCGICLGEGGLAARGCIDSCWHSFCFVCIMEWAREESRCPLCKRRFSSVRRPPKPGVFDRERIVPVPVRDQACRYLGNATREVPDMYAGVNCSECHSSKDENLLLLCDLCDLAAHTYCVGLGNIVPEGDWFCHDCALSRDDYVNCESISDSDNDNICKSEAHVSIFDIVRDEGNADESSVGRSVNQGHDSQLRNESSVSSSNNQGHNSQPRDDTLHRSTLFMEKSHSTPRETMLEQQYARTTRRLLYMHGRIRALRENWNAIRSGSMSFLSPVVSTSSGGILKKCSRLATCSEPVQPCDLTSAKCEPRLRGSTTCEESSSKGSTDVDRAWKKLKMAQKVHRSQSSTKVVGEAMYRDSRLSVVNVRHPDQKALPTKTSMDDCRDCPSCQVQKAYNFKMSEKKKPDLQKYASTDMPESGKKLSISNAPGKQLSKSLRQDVSSGIGKQACQKRSLEIIELSRRQTDHPCIDSSSVASCLSSDQMKVACLSCKGQPSEMEGVLNECCEGSLRKDDGAKSEIQSLVKLNLKLLNQGQQLDVAKFKEIARLSTHTILAACGMQHARSCVWRLSMSIECRHLGQIQNVPISNLMPGSCRECFFLFVREVVNSIMLERFA